MTTAGRPTFDPARGGGQRGEKSLSALSKQYSSRDLPAHTKLKYRQSGQGTSDENRGRDFRKELEERERIAYPDRKPRPGSSSVASSSCESTAKKLALPQPPPSASELEADDRDSDINDSGGGSSDSDSEDETAELLAELKRIKQERAEEEAKKEADRKAAEEKIRMQNIMSGNPLLSTPAAAAAAPDTPSVSGASGSSSNKTDFRVKRRWDDDVVFKNCARSEPDRSKVTFVNDTLRSEFHKKFMDKYIK